MADPPAEDLPIFVLTIDPQRYAATAAELRRHGLAARPYHGVVGKAPTTRHRPDLSFFARHFSPDAVLGAALSHLQLANELAEAWPPGAPAVLVLEDDVLVAGATPQMLASLARGAGDWDVLKLYCQGRCAPRARLFSGSGAAYLLSQWGARRVAALHAVYYFDMQLSSPELCTLNGPQLFTTRDPRGALLIGDQSLSFWLKQACLRVPGLGVTVTLGGVALALASLAVLGWMLRSPCPVVALVGISLPLAALCAIYSRAHGLAAVRREGRVLAVTVGAAVACAGLLLLMGRGEAAWAWAVPALLFLEVTLCVGCMGLASAR
jgi:hypothetical protein